MTGSTVLFHMLFLMYIVRMPAEVDTEHIGCSLSADGVLSVEAPLPASGTRRTEEIVIPIQIQQQQ